MTQAEVRAAVLEALSQVAPEVDGAALQGPAPLREQVELDSMDWLRFLTALEQRLAVSVPEADYRQLESLDAVVGYLSAKLGPGARSNAR